MKKPILQISMIIGIAFLIFFNLKCKRSTNSSPESKVTPSSLSFTSPDSIFRFMNDSVGFAYTHNGVKSIDNLDTISFTYTAGGVVYTCSNFLVEELSSGIYYLTFKGINGSDYMSIALPLIIDIPGTDPQPTVTCANNVNTCAGHCCSKCAFTLDRNGCIDGCSCNTPGPGCSLTSDFPPRCDHSISTGGSVYGDFILNYSEYPIFGNY